MSEQRSPILTTDELVVDYGRRGRGFRALHGVSLDVGHGECVGLVGESGSGKSTLGRTVLGLTPVTSGRITFDARDISHAPWPQRRSLAADLQVVFQDPYGSLDPAMTVGNTLTEPLTMSGLTKPDARRRVAQMVDRVRLPQNVVDRYPSEFSGGQRQRIAIARALVRQPRLVICDEPVSALDLTTQAVIIDLFIELQRETGVSYVFISHDLSVVRRISHRVAVMKRGELVEFGDGPTVTSDPEHPYSQRLLAASPVADPAAQAERRRAWLNMRDVPAAS